MKKFIVDDSYWKLFPHSKIGVILIHNYKMNEDLVDELEQLLSVSNG